MGAYKVKAFDWDASGPVEPLNAEGTQDDMYTHDGFWMTAGQLHQLNDRTAYKA